MASVSLAVYCSVLICLNAVGGASKGGSHAVAENDKGLCDDPLPPYFGSVSCTHKKNHRYVCIAECKNGYEFSNHKTKMIHRCHKQSGKWTPEEHFPDCQPICEPPCDNGGKCIEDNHCVCTSDHRGDRCEFSTSLCDPAVGLRVTANWKCNDTSLETVCVLTCPQGMQYEAQPADIYHCSVDGVWNPNYAPKCLPINIIEPPKSHGMFPLTTGQAVNYLPSGVCAAWGQLHYRTFDGGIFSFQGSCTYLLAKDCVDNTFSIHIKGNSSCAGKTSCKLSVIIISGINEYVLSNTQDGPSVVWKSESYLIPTAINGLLFQMMSGYVTVSSSLGFRLKWNREDSVLLKVNDRLKNKTCGLCGRFDGTILNDFEMSDGTITENVEMFVDSWTMDKLSEVCPQGVTVQHPCINDKLDKSIANAAGEVCEAIFDTRFAACHNLVEPKLYFEACKMDYCACFSSSGTECICSTLTEYFRECVRLGGKIEGGWRSPNLCALSCPEEMIYEDCGTSCPKTCKSTVYNCEDSHCVDGCHCRSGTVLHNGKCVLQEACPCIHNGKEYQPGHKMALDCNGCECIGGKWECTKQKCEAQCSSVADPHYTTFDGLKYEFLGECSYYLVYHENFTIVQENALCNSLVENPSFSLDASCTKSVKINYQGNMLILNPHMQVIFNDNEINSLPLAENGITAYKATSQFLKVDLPNDVSLKWDGKNRIYIDAPPSLFGQTRGLCGTFNRNQKDDFLTSDDDIEADVKLFAERWKVEDSCHKRPRRSGISACELNPEKAVKAEKLCSVLKSEIFAACHDELDPDSAYRGCVYDTCACGQNVKDCFCPALSDYSAHCTRKGIMIEWTERVPACRQNCEGGQIYQECGNPCTSSCLVITSPALCKQTCVQGCSCPDGKTLNSDGFCIPIDECPCVYESKEYSPKSLITQGANICQCVNAQWNCNPADLKELIKLNPDFMIQDQPLSCSAENHEEETLCIEECPLTCQNMHLPLGCKTKICKRGCRCQNGYLLDTDLKKCVKLSECGCRHGGRKYAEGSAIRKDCNTCVCQKGTWQCSTDTCPGMCTVWGESHFKTYDDRIYDFHGECEYILSKGKIDEEKYFSLSIQNVPCGTSGVTCSKSFTLSVGKDEEITLTKETPIPKTKYGSHFIVVESGLFVFIYTDIGISLQWDKGTRLYVTLNPKWRERVVGLCGNFNDDQSDDFQTPSGGLTEARAVIFADSWKTNDVCKKPNLIADACVHPDREAWAHQKCSIFKSDVFAPCHSEVALDPYYERCISDSCACDLGGDCDCLCTAIATYAHECNIHGVHIKWRSQQLCPIQCEECATYDACMSPCPKTTCETQYLYSGLAEKCTAIPCVEGCDPKPCPDGEMYNNGRDYKCIPEVECESPCLEINGKLYVEGERISDPTVVDQCQSCHCLRGKINCTGELCTIPNEETFGTTEITVGCSKTGWTPWMNTGHSIEGDNELLDNSQLKQIYNYYCDISSITDIECRVAGSKVHYKETGQVVHCSLPQGLECINEEQTSGHCEDYEIRLFCSCVSTVTTTPYSTPAVTPCSPTWTNYFNIDNPTNDKIIGGDFEIIQTIKKNHEICSNSDIIDVECKASYNGKLIDYKETGQKDLTCSKDKGFICVNRMQENRMCHDYKVRFLCSCIQTHCTPGWTDFYNTDSPHSGNGDEESIKSLSLQYQFCSVNEVTNIECVTDQKQSKSKKSKLVTIDYTETKDKAVICDVRQGLLCLNSNQGKGHRCSDYRVRLFCQCGATTVQPPTTLIKKPKITPTMPEIITTTICPDGQAYFKCAYYCNQTCSSFPAQFNLTCDNEDNCIEGCRPLEDCKPPNLWRDYSTCVKKEECTCILNGTLVPPGKVVSNGCEKCQCMENSLLCHTSKDCFPISSRSWIRTTPVVVEENCWTKWINIDSPLSGAGDFEHINKLQFTNGLCPYPVEIECRVASSKLKASDAGQSVECDLKTGLQCWNRNNGEEGCYDYEIRYFCPCETTVVPTVTLPPMTIPPTFPTGPCEDGWTQWYNSHTVDNQGDYENVLSARADGKIFCSTDMITAIECRSTTTKSEALQHSVLCDLENGLLCRNADNGFFDQCDDYEVRFYCDCLPPTETSTETTTAPTVTLPPMTLPPTFPTGPCEDGWTQWYNSHRVDDQGDYENVQSARARGKIFCSTDMISAIECRSTSTKSEALQHSVLCDLENGLLCRNADNSFYEQCDDYEVRFYCDCLPPTETTTKTAAPTVSLPPTTLPPSFPTGPCEDGWTPWYNSHRVDDQGDYENVQSARAHGKIFCSTDMISSIECRSTSTKSEALQHGVLCDLENGLLCRNTDNSFYEQCDDYEVRFYCDCLPPTETTTKTTAARTVTLLPKTVPPTFPTGPCEDGWTPWYNSHIVDDLGDDENVLTVRARGKIFCSTDMISAIECRSTTTKTEALQHGVLCNLENGLICRNADNSFYDQCDDYEVRFYCDCLPPTETTTTAPTVTIPPMTLPPTFPTGPCEDGWTQWYNSHRVDDQGDYENVLSARAHGKIFCSTDMIVAIECRSTTTKSETLQHGVLCDLENGLMCRNGDNSFYDHCDDYEVRFYCDCLPPTELISKTAAPTVSLPPTTLPPSFPTGPCEDGWTPWYNSHRVDDQGDYENVQSARAHGKIFCSTDMISSIECRSTSTKSEALQHGVLCDLENGLLCRNTDNSFYEQCVDYEVRFYCDCLPPTETTIKTTAARTVTLLPKTVPPTFPTGPCEDGWTPWYNSHIVDDQGDDENVLTVRARGKIFCSTDMISAIECRSITTKTEALQHGVLCNLENGLICRNADNSFYDQCDDYEVRFYCDCLPPTETTTTAPTVTIPPMTLPPTFPTGPCEDGWTQWYNSHRVDDQGDYENVLSARAHGKIFCSTDMIVAIECRSTTTKSETLQHGVLCDLENGLMCRNGDNSFYDHCDDYEVRFYCDCLPPTELISKTAAPTVSLPPTTLPPSFPTGPCEDGWTPWYNSHRVDDQGDYENVQSARAHGKIFCSTDMISSIECRSTSTKSEALQHGVLCDLENGLLCRNTDNSFYEQCVDYEVRFYCDCLPPTETTIKTTAARTVTLLPKTVPPTFPTGPCEDGWTPWYNSHIVDDQGDDENVLTVRARGKIFCSTDMISAIECRSITTKTEALQHGVLCNLENGLICRNADNSFYDQCDDYEVRFYCDCLPPTETTTKTAAPTVSLPPTTLPPTFPTGPCEDGWTPWYNSHRVDDQGDYENVQSARAHGKIFCSTDMISSIECRSTSTKSEALQHGVLCDLENGLLCRNTDNSFYEQCDDYEVRFYCDCLPPTETTTKTTAAPTVTLPPMTLPPTFPTGPCEDGWTQWYNSHTIDEQGDYENVLSARAHGKIFCSTDMITAIECRSTRTKTEALQHGVLCDLENGLICRNADNSFYEQCDDYEVRFYCDCLPPTEATTTTTETPSVTTACNVWSRWINDNTPVTESTKKAIKGGKTGDTEKKFLYRLQVEENFCMQGELTKIDCRDAETDVTYTETGDAKLVCSVKRGFLCRGKDQPSGVCKDYKIRYFCSCEAYVSTFSTEITEENTTPTEIWKAGTVTSEECVKYSSWIDISSSETGIDEPIESIIFKAKICSKPFRIECRNEQKNLDYSKIGQNMFCDLEHGLQCKNEDQSDGSCHTYQVRIACWLCEQTITPTSPVLLCPETPESMTANCAPGCPSGLLCDGTMCVEHADCPCFKQNKKFKPGNIHVTSDCQVCDCVLEGYSTCKPITCNLKCDEGQKPKLTDDCDCKCEGCPSGTRICNTNRECIKEELWCDGTVHCPDDEIYCTTTEQIETIVTETTYPTENPEIICSTDFESETASCDMMVNYFDTFDGLEYQYEICDHILLEEIGNGKFSVTVHKACSPEDSNKCWKYVMIYVDDIIVKLGPGNEDLEFNGQKISIQNIQLLSNRHHGIILKQYGNWLMFQSLNYNFDVIWDSRQNVKIVVSKCLINQVSGLCGFYNKYILDDRQQPNGTLVHSNKDFGDSWSIGPLERCSLPSCPDEIMANALKICQQLENPPFVNCSSVLSNNNQIEVCVAFMCECLKDPESEKHESCKCQALGDFVETCEFENNVLMPDWRIEHDCASPVCPPDMEWNECGAGCKLTCDNYRERETICTNDCVPGCYCSSGLVQHNGHCIKPKMCHDCVCDGYGDPNYYTFDSRSYAFQGNCTYVLAQHQSHDDILSFRVLSTNVECVEEPHTTCTYGLRVEWKGHFAEIRNNNKEVYFDGFLLKAADYPFENEGFNIVSTLGEKTEIYVKEINLAVLYSNRLYSYSIRLPSFLYFNQTEGLCGICNFDGSDDFYHKDGYITDDINDFAYSWLVDSSREECTLPPIHPTPPPPGICNFTDNACEVIIDSTWYSQACLNDVTYSKNPEASVCRSKIQYAKKCCERGISLRNWLLESECDLTCPGDMIFECASQCQKTCNNYKVYDQNNCDPEYTCTCPMNKVLKDGQCVDSILCETCEDGHLVGDQWDEGLCQTCECTNELTINCIKNSCPDPPICGMDEKLEVIPPHPNACCNLYSCVPSATSAPKRLCLYQHHYDVVNGSNLQLSQEQYYVEAYELGSSWEDGLCIKCSCKETDGQIAQNCEIEQCPTVTDLSNTNGYVQENIPGICCPKYHRAQCVSDGKLHMINEEWPSPDGDKCKTFKCVKGPNGDAIVSEKKTLCDTTCPRYAIYEEPEPESPHCCGHCKTTVCEEGGIIHQEGDTWQPASEPCFTAKCIISGNMPYITYRENSCPAIPDNCPKEHIILDPKGCCKICRIIPGMCTPVKIPEKDTVGYFKLEDFERGECKNNEPISDLMRCSGRCESTASYYSQRNSFENHCKCCEAQASEERKVTLDCTDGTKIVKIYQQPTDCYCSACANDVIGVPIAQ